MVSLSTAPATELLTPAWTRLRPHPVQAQLWTTRARFVAVPAGRGSGKTELARRRLVRYLPLKKPWPDPKYFYGAPTMPQAKRIAWFNLLRLIPKWWIKDISYAELVIFTIFGSELHIVGLDRPQRVEGLQWDGCVIDESCDIKPGTFDLNILPALTWREGWCWRIGVPKRFGVGAVEFRDFYEHAIAGDTEGEAGFTWPSSDILPPSALRYAQEHMDPRDYDEQFNASFVKSTGGIFWAFDQEYNVRPCGYNRAEPLIIGSDFNVDPMAWVIGHKRDGVLEIFDEIFLHNANTPLACKVLYERYQHHRGGFEFYGDATARARKTSTARSDYACIQEHEGFLRLGRTIHYLNANPPTADRFAATNGLICNSRGERRLFVDPKCKHLIHDLRTRTYKPGTRDADDQGDQGHISDALGYIIYKLYPIRIRIDSRNETYEVTVTGEARKNHGRN